MDMAKVDEIISYLKSNDRKTSARYLLNVEICWVNWKFCNRRKYIKELLDWYDEFHASLRGNKDEMISGYLHELNSMVDDVKYLGLKRKPKCYL